MNTLLQQLQELGAETEQTVLRFSNHVEIYQKYLLKFPEEPTMQHLKTAMQQKNYISAQKAAHTLKGLAGNLGLLPIFDIAADLSDTLKSENFTQSEEIFAELLAQYRVFSDCISHWNPNA